MPYWERSAIGSERQEAQQLLEATAKLALRLADAHQILLQDCGFTWFVGTEQGRVLLIMFGVSAEWKRLKEQTPHLLKKPLHVLMMECILKELAARLAKVAQDEAARGLAIQADWMTEAGQWKYKAWDPTKKALVDTGATPLDHAGPG